MTRYLTVWDGYYDRWGNWMARRDGITEPRMVIEGLHDTIEEATIALAALDEAAGEPDPLSDRMTPAYSVVAFDSWLDIQHADFLGEQRAWDWTKKQNAQSVKEMAIRAERKRQEELV